MTAGPEPNEQAAPGDPLSPGVPPSPYEVPTAPLEVAPAPVAQPAPAAGPGPTPPPPEPAAPAQSSLVSAGGDQCPGCGVQMAADQRYCLACGHRRGDPRLPFMDAVVFMDAAKQPPQAAATPPPPSAQRPRISANASLIAGIATLVLAVGVGVLIGRTGENGAAPVAATPQVIKVGGGTEPESTTPSATGKAKGKGTAKKTTPKEESEATAAAEKATEEVYTPAPGVNLAKPGSVQKGGACETGTAGCENGKFEGNFFGE